jgi:hypothetical protein
MDNLLFGELTQKLFNRNFNEHGIHFVSFTVGEKVDESSDFPPRVNNEYFIMRQFIFVSSHGMNYEMLFPIWQIDKLVDEYEFERLFGKTFQESPELLTQFITIYKIKFWKNMISFRELNAT